MMKPAAAALPFPAILNNAGKVAPALISPPAVPDAWLTTHPCEPVAALMVTPTPLVGVWVWLPVHVGEMLVSIGGEASLRMAVEAAPLTAVNPTNAVGLAKAEAASDRAG